LAEAQLRTTVEKGELRRRGERDSVLILQRSTTQMRKRDMRFTGPEARGRREKQQGKEVTTKSQHRPSSLNVNS